MADYYSTLGVDKNVSVTDLKKAYRKLAIKHHPDKNPDNKQAEEKFKEISEAYDVLSNPDKKQQYDMYGSVNSRHTGGGFDPSDIFNRFRQGFSGFGGGWENAMPQTKGPDLRLHVNVTLKDIADGITKKIKIKRNVKCSSCNGEGAKNGTSYSICSTCNGVGKIQRITRHHMVQIIQETGCHICHGSGKIIKEHCSPCTGSGYSTVEEQIDIEIPAGVEQNDMLIKQGFGNFAKEADIEGDLRIVIDEIKHPDLIKNNNHIIYQKTLNILDFVFGTEIYVYDAREKLNKIKVKPGSQSGDILLLRGKGVEVLNSNLPNGNMYIILNAYIPNTLSKDEKAILLKLKESDNFKTDKNIDTYEKMKNIFF